MNPFMIDKVVIRRCEAVSPHYSYTTGEIDPDYIGLIAEVYAGNQVGYGECVATSLMYPGHPASAQIDEWNEIIRLGNGLLGQDCRLLWQWEPEELRGRFDYNSIVDALDFAVYDLAGKLQNISLQTLLGGGRREVDAMAVVHTGTAAEMAATAAAYQQRYGVGYFKLKPIGEVNADIEVMRKIAEALPVQPHIYSDPNYGLVKTDIDSVVAYLNALHPLGLEVCEDPVETTLDVYGMIQQRTKVKLMLDVLARSPQQVMALAAARCAAQINIHADWAGGFRLAQQKGFVAATGGMSAMIGSTYYLGIGSAAYQTLSSVLPGRLPCEQIDCSYWNGPAVVEAEYPIVNGKIQIPFDRPGLGVTVIPKKLDQVTVARIEIV